MKSCPKCKQEANHLFTHEICDWDGEVIDEVKVCGPCLDKWVDAEEKEWKQII